MAHKKTINFFTIDGYGINNNLFICTLLIEIHTDLDHN